MFLTTFCGLVFGFCTKMIINWLSIEGYKIKIRNIFPEITSLALCYWAFSSLPTSEAIIFGLIVNVLIGISLIDYNTMQIPLVFILIGLVTIVASNFVKIVSLSSILWGIFVGACIPLIIVGTLWLITKRQGMGFGDIQMGIILGAWLGPFRMAITLFFASLMSLIVWVCVSLLHGFDKDRAIPMAPFLSVAGVGTFIGSLYYPNIFHLLII